MLVKSSINWMSAKWLVTYYHDEWWWWKSQCICHKLTGFKKVIFFVSVYYLCVCLISWLERPSDWPNLWLSEHSKHSSVVFQRPGVKILGVLNMPNYAFNSLSKCMMQTSNFSYFLPHCYCRFSVTRSFKTWSQNGILVNRHKKDIGRHFAYKLTLTVQTFL